MHFRSFFAHLYLFQCTFSQFVPYQQFLAFTIKDSACVSLFIRESSPKMYRAGVVQAFSLLARRSSLKHASVSQLCALGRLTAGTSCRIPCPSLCLYVASFSLLGETVRKLWTTKSPVRRFHCAASMVLDSVPTGAFFPPPPVEYQKTMCQPFTET
jgi:hypothetical protein